MPIYEYQCETCRHQLDALQKVSDPPLVSCPECGADALKRLISAPRFRLKGSGWYETDFKKDNRRNLAAGEDKAGTGAAGDGQDTVAGAGSDGKKAGAKETGTGDAGTAAKTSAPAGDKKHD